MALYTFVEVSPDVDHVVNNERPLAKDVEKPRELDPATGNLDQFTRQDVSRLQQGHGSDNVGNGETATSQAPESEQPTNNTTATSPSTRGKLIA